MWPRGKTVHEFWWPKRCGQRGMLHNQNNNEASIGNHIVFSTPHHHCSWNQPCCLWESLFENQTSNFSNHFSPCGPKILLNWAWLVLSHKYDMFSHSHPPQQSEVSKMRCHLLSSSLGNNAFCPCYGLVLSRLPYHDFCCPSPAVNLVWVVCLDSI